MHLNFQCDRIEGVPGILGNKGKKEKYQGEQGDKNLFQGTWKQRNLYKFSFKGDVDGEGRGGGVSKYDETGKYKEKVSERC